MELLGAVELEAGHPEKAESTLRRALEISRKSPSLLCRLGLALSARKCHSDAVDAFRQAVDADPREAGYHLNLANELMQVDAWDEAIGQYEQALTLRTGFYDALNGLGAALQISGRREEAIARFREATESRPDHPLAHDNLGDALLRAGRAEEAEASFRRAVNLDPDNADYHADLGNVLLEQQRWDQAIASYRCALDRKPEYPEALNSLGSALMERGDPAAAIEPIQRAIALRPDSPEAHDNLGNAFLQSGRWDETDACFQRAIQLQPDDPARHLRYANVLAQQYRWEDAIPHYRRTLELDNGSADAEYGLASIRLFYQDFEHAWPGYERRLETVPYQKKHFRNFPPSLAQFQALPRWQGPGETGVRRLAVWTEQGIGDQVLFSTLIPDLAKVGVPVLYEIDNRLLAAYQRAFPALRFMGRQDPPQDALREADRVIAIGSLPQHFRNSKQSFERQPAKLLGAMPERVATYRTQLDAQASRFRVAFSWRSTRKDWYARTKSAPLAEFLRLLEIPGVRFLDVQYGDTAAERAQLKARKGVELVRFEPVDYYNDLEELLAILEACDLVITTSNATAHFAGAIGKRTWLMYLEDRPPFHYWAHGGTYRCLWYPSVEIVSAPHLRDWSQVAEHVARKLSMELESGAMGVTGGRAS